MGILEIARLRERRALHLCGSGTLDTRRIWTETGMGLAVNSSRLFLLLTLALAACGSSDAYSGDDAYEESFADIDSYSEVTGGGYYAAEEEEREPFDEDLARERAEEEVADDGYYGPCTIDCSGHDAGFAWAAEGNEDDGLSSSQSFDDGQIAYEDAVDERVEEYRQAYEDGEEVY